MHLTDFFRILSFQCFSHFHFEDLPIFVLQKQSVLKLEINFKLRCKNIAKTKKGLFCISCILISITIQWFQHHLFFSKRRLASWLSYKAGIQFPALPIGLFCDFANSQSLCTSISLHYKGDSSTFLYHSYVLGNIRSARY